MSSRWLSLGLVAVCLFGRGLCACAGSAQKSAQPAARAPSASIDARLQGIADDEAGRARAEWGAKRVAVVVLDPHRGAVLALHDDAPGAPVVPASTLRTLTVALALDAALITPEQHFDCGNGSRAYGAVALRDPGQHGSLDASEILEVSSNIGVSRIFDVLGADRFNDGMRRFHVAIPGSIEGGTMRGAVIANGEGSTLTPLALAAAYGVFANDGLLAVPGAAPERIIKESTARTVRSMLESVVTAELGTGKAAAVSGVRVGGKTGTSDPSPDCEVCPHGVAAFANFVGIVPLDAPRWVIYVGVADSQKEGTGGTIAAPVFSRIATRALSP
ncbi:MAG TPA: penicillin-binding transpeptidase domain-containing protein [Polyangiaceae bacterium]